MSGNPIVLALIAVCFFTMAPVKAKELKVLREDELIIQGILYEEYKAFDRSRVIYGKLYDATGEKVYLFKEITSSIFSGTNIEGSIKRLKKWDQKHPDTLEAKRLFIPLYLTVNRIKEAKTEAEGLLERSDKSTDLELASKPFLYTGEFKRALELLEQVYQKTSNEDVLLRMSVIMDEYTQERIRAIQLLETHRRMNSVSHKVYFKLLALYIKENDIDGLLSIYKVLYEEEKNEKYLKKIIEAYAYKKDISGAIDFLEKNGVEEVMLYELYKRKKLFDKALQLTDRLYAERKDPRWIAEKAVLIFEKAENKNDKAMIKEVVSYFEKAIALGVDDSIYFNYYGYTLIDKEIDVKKGIKVIQAALKQQPDNIYYLDSLAWGYYKEHQCKKAHELMKKVVSEEGMKEQEIIEHWDMIQKCQ